VDEPKAEVRFAAELRQFLKPGHRAETVRVACDGVSTLGHVVQSLGVPLTEAGCLLVNGIPVTPGYRPGGGDMARIGAVTRPQPVPVALCCRICPCRRSRAPATGLCVGDAPRRGRAAAGQAVQVSIGVWP